MKRFVSLRTLRTLRNLRSLHALQAAGFEGDPGAQPQRTVLAWQRTVLAAGVGCFALAFAAQRQGRAVLAALAGVLGAAVVLLLLFTLRTWTPGHSALNLHIAAASAAALASLGTLVAVLGILR